MRQPVCMVQATWFTSHPGGQGIVTRLSEVLGLKGFPTGSNSSISQSFRNFCICSQQMMIFCRYLSSGNSLIFYSANTLHRLTLSATSIISLASFVIAKSLLSSSYLINKNLYFSALFLMRVSSASWSLIFSSSFSSFKARSAWCFSEYPSLPYISLICSTCFW